MTTENWSEELNKIINNAFQVVVNYCRNPTGEVNVIVQEGQKIEDFISTLLSKERNEAYEKGFTTGRQGVELECKEAMKLNYWDKEKRNEVIDEVKKEVEKLEIKTPTQVAELNKHLPSTLQIQSYNNAVGYVDAIEDISTLLENLKVK